MPTIAIHGMHACPVLATTAETGGGVAQTYPTSLRQSEYSTNCSFCGTSLGGLPLALKGLQNPIVNSCQGLAEAPVERRGHCSALNGEPNHSGNIRREHTHTKAH